MHACRCIQANVEYELVINKSSENIVHGGWLPRRLCVRCVLGTFAIAGRVKRHRSRFSLSESPLQNFGVLDCELWGLFRERALYSCRTLTIYRLYLGDINYYHSEDMLYALCVVAGLATLAMLLEPQWSGTNALFGGIATHVLVGQLYASKAIEACCFQPQSHASYRKNCVFACARLVMVDLSGAIFFSLFGTDFGVVLRQLISRDVSGWTKQPQAR